MGKAALLAALLFFTIFLSFGSVRPTSADVLPEAIVTLNAASGGMNPTLVYSGPFTEGPAQILGQSYPADPGGTYPAGFATAIAYNSPAPAVSVEAAGNSAVYSDLKYYFEVTGPANTTVPIVISGSFISTGSVNLWRGQAGFGTVGADMGIEITDVATSNLIANFSPYSLLGVNWAGGTAPFLVKASAASGVIYQVDLFVETDPDFNNATSGLTAGGYGDVDPIISMDPAFSGADQFQLEFSPGIGDSPVPIPPSAFLFLPGLVGLAALRRRCTR